MSPLSSIRQARLFSTSALLQRFSSFNWVYQASSHRSGFLGCLKSFSAGAQSSENVGNLEKNLDQQTAKENASASFASSFRSNIHPSRQTDFGSGGNFRSRDFVGNLEKNLDQQTVKENPSASFASRFRSYLHPSGQTDFGSGGNFRSMDFVREAIEGDKRGGYRGSQFPQQNVEQNADFVHIKLMRNNTFVTVTDSNGNKKCGASAGQLSELKGGTKVSRYAAEATAEHVGRLARNMGIKSVVIKVKGFTHFKKKRQAILSFREGFCNSRLDRNPVVYIEDTTRRPHNGCRLPKKRRV